MLFPVMLSSSSSTSPTTSCHQQHLLTSSYASISSSSSAGGRFCVWLHYHTFNMTLGASVNLQHVNFSVLIVHITHSLATEYNHSVKSSLHVWMRNPLSETFFYLLFYSHLEIQLAEKLPETCCQTQQKHCSYYWCQNTSETFDYLTVLWRFTHIWTVLTWVFNGGRVPVEKTWKEVVLHKTKRSCDEDFRSVKACLLEESISSDQFSFYLYSNNKPNLAIISYFIYQLKTDPKTPFKKAETSDRTRL